MICGTATIGGEAVVLAVLDFTFLGGSMGVVVGERLARAAELAAGKKRPLIAAVSVAAHAGREYLLQWPRPPLPSQSWKEAGVPFISILSDPTTGGVFASFASLADIVIAEPEALIGLAGPRGRANPGPSVAAWFAHRHFSVGTRDGRRDRGTTRSTELSDWRAACAAAG